jgi:hypothetical protein
MTMRHFLSTLRFLCLLALPLCAAGQHSQGHAARNPRAALAIGAAFAPSGALWIVGLDPQARLFVQASSDDGRSWGPQRLLETAGDAIAADGENRPKLVFGPDGQAVITYTRPLSKPYTGEIRLLRSTDGAGSFSPPVTVHRDRQLITHRFEAVAFDARGILHTVWIDKRELQGPAGKPVKGYRGAALYRNESRDGGRSFGPDIKLADHSCECCRIALSPSPDGGLAALWRHVFAPNQRDHAFALLDGDGPARAEPVRASLDRWAIDACPHHGPGLSPAAGGGYHAVWFGERAGVAGVRYGQLAADGSPRGVPLLLPDSGAEHADVQSAGERVAIVWRSFDGRATLWRAWVSADNGRSFSLKELGRSQGPNDHPRLVRRGDEIHALWRTMEGVSVERLVP